MLRRSIFSENIRELKLHFRDSGAFSVGIIRFEEYELDERNFRLRRSGMDVKLERIPMELLLLLATRSGELVRRDEIIEKLWGSNINVDAENAINTAVRKVRLALADDPT